jgi:hypothetical protein
MFCLPEDRGGGPHEALDLAMANPYTTVTSLLYPTMTESLYLISIHKKGCRH